MLMHVVLQMYHHISLKDVPESNNAVDLTGMVCDCRCYVW